MILLGITLLSMILLATTHTSIAMSESSFDAASFQKPLVVTLDQRDAYSYHQQAAVLAAPVPETHAYRCETKTLQQVKDNLNSQQGEDVELMSHFNGICGGRYIEMGALDGKTFSNSWLFRQEFHWKGVLIELDNQEYNKLKRNRPRDLLTTRAAICPMNETVHYVSGHAAVNGIWEHASLEFREKWWPDIAGPQDLETLQCLQLQQLLEENVAYIKDENGLFYFDFFSLDVEGSEWKTLQTIHWERTHFGIILVEAPDSKGMEKNAIVSFLQGQEYRFLGEKNNSLWFLNGNFHEIYKDFLS